MRFLLQRLLSLSTLHCDQFVGDIVLVDVGHVIDGLCANTVCRNDFDVINPDDGGSIPSA